MLLSAKHQMSVIFGREPWWAEFWSSMAAIGWALVAFSADDIVKERAAFIQLSILASPTFWEMSGVTLGCLQLFALLFANPYGRAFSAFMCAWWWTFITMSIIMNDPRAPSMALYIVFAAINLFSMVKLGRRYG